jgi:hypothetical protein
MCEPTKVANHAASPSKEWLGAESNRRHEDFQSSALPTELPSRRATRFAA